jgi:hypothetical protein
LAHFTFSHIFTSGERDRITKGIDDSDTGVDDLELQDINTEDKRSTNRLRVTTGVKPELPQIRLVTDDNNSDDSINNNDQPVPVARTYVSTSLPRINTDSVVIPTDQILENKDINPAAHPINGATNRGVNLIPTYNADGTYTYHISEKPLPINTTAKPSYLSNYTVGATELKSTTISSTETSTIQPNEETQVTPKASTSKLPETPLTAKE